MGKVIRQLGILENSSVVDYLKEIYSVNTDLMEKKVENKKTTYKNIELDSILVNAIEEEKNIYITKLVSLKAFLLSKEQGMDINNLLLNIDKVMCMSSGLALKDSGIVFDNALKSFFSKADMNIIDNSEKSIKVSDGKRKVILNIKENKIDFNSIEEVL